MKPDLATLPAYLCRINSSVG